MLRDAAIYEYTSKFHGCPANIHRAKPALAYAPGCKLFVVLFRCQSSGFTTTLLLNG